MSELFPIGVLYARTHALIKVYRHINAVMAAGFDGEAVLSAIAGKHIYAGRRWRNMAAVEPVPPSDRDTVRRFLALHYHAIDGQAVRFSDVFETFIGWLPLDEKQEWSKIRFTRSLPDLHQAGSGNANVTFILNLSRDDVLPEGTRLSVNSRGRIVKAPRAA